MQGTRANSFRRFGFIGEWYLEFARCLPVRVKHRYGSIASILILQTGVAQRGLACSDGFFQEPSFCKAPYYLDQLDRIAGCAHLEVPEAEGRRIVCELQSILPGYLVPKYVQEIASETSETTLI